MCIYIFILSSLGSQEYQAWFLLHILCPGTNIVT